MPLIAKGTAQGVLDIFHRAPLTASPAWRDLLETLGSQAAIAIENARLYEAERQARTAAEAARAALRESEARFRLIAENAHDLIALLNSAGYYIYVFWCSHPRKQRCADTPWVRPRNWSSRSRSSRCRRRLSGCDCRDHALIRA
jgi:hypothetical protein